MPYQFKLHKVKLPHINNRYKRQTKRNCPFNDTQFSKHIISLRQLNTHPTAVLEDDAYHVGDPTPRLDTAIVVERALLRLPVEQRAAVVAVDMQGYSVAETARMLGVAEGTVKSRCSRARAKLAEALEYFNAGAAAAAERLSE